MLLQDLVKAEQAADARKEAKEPDTISEAEASKVTSDVPAKVEAASVVAEPVAETPKAAEPKPIAKTDPARVAELRTKLEAERLRVSAEMALKAKEKAEREAKLAQDNPTLAALEKVKEIEAENQALKKQMADKANQEAYDKHREEIKTLVADSDKYEYISKTGESEMVLNYMVQHFTDTNELLSKEDACDVVEAHLEQIAEKFAKTNKIKAKFKDTTPSSPVTLTQRLAQETPTVIVKPEKTLLTYDERIEAMKQTLKNSQ